MVDQRGALPPAGDIVIFQPEFVEFGGEERVILSLSEGLHAQGKAHSVLCYHDHIDLADYARLPLRVYPLNPPTSAMARVWALRQALLRLREEGAPVPVLFSIQSALHAGLAGLPGGLPFHVRIPDTYRLLAPPRATEQSPQTRLTLWAQHWATQRGVRAASRLVTNTQALANEMQQLYQRRAEVIYLGGFGQAMPDSPPRTASPVELLSVSRLQASKRIDWILRALAALPQGKGSPGAVPPWRLHVVGDGPEREALQALGKSLGLADQVVFHGFVGDDQLDALYERSHVFLMPAIQGYGLPAIEALYRHSAVVMNEESGAAEILAGTPWVSVAAAGEPAFHTAVRDMLVQVAQPGFFEQPLPPLPSMQTWARDLIARLGW